MLKREQWLEQQLARGDLAPHLRDAYERELDSIAEAITKVQAAQKALLKAGLDSKIARLTEIREKLLAEDGDFIMALGQEEFGRDYEVREEGAEVVVYSHAARDFQENRRAHSNMEDAMADLRYLYRNRLYDRYVRTGEMDQLLELVQKTG